MENIIEIATVIGIGLVVSIISIIYVFLTRDASSYRISKDIEIAQQKLIDQSQKVAPVFDLLMSKFELYIDGNQRQNKIVPSLTFVMIIIGFIMIAIGIFYSRGQVGNAISGQQLFAIAAGALSEFIAATILVVYKTVFQQTVEYFKAIERLIPIGLAVKILDEIIAETQDEEVRTKTRIEFSNMLLVGKRNKDSSDKADESK